MVGIARNLLNQENGHLPSNPDFPVNRKRGCSYLLLICLWFTLASGCNNTQQQQQTANVGQFAYVAPMSVNLRSQLNQKNSTVAVLHHGERVTLTDVRRRYMKIRTANGAEGWVDSLELLSPAEMQKLTNDRKEAAKLPVEGTATAYELLNIHLAPNRKSPAFAQIPEGGSLSILARKLTPRLGPVPKPTVTFERPVPARRRRGARALGLTPPKPPAPVPPESWQSSFGVQEPEPAERVEKPKPAEPDKPVVIDAWNLVRTKDGQIGWVLARNLMMSIPDDVAQYAAGKHITSFFEIGTVHDEEQGVKHDWLWTTVSDVEPVDFDSWRVFIWNRRRHRYETSYRQRDLVGQFPVQVEPQDPSIPGRVFKLITRDKDEQLRRRTYRFDGTLVHLVGTEDFTIEGEITADDSQQNAKPGASKQSGWFAARWAALKHRLFGK
jgi:SH3-like domain-containing protein